VKKLILPVIALLLVTTLVGCGEGGSGKNSPNVTGDSSVTTEVMSLLKSFASAMLNEDVKGFANCLAFPFSSRNDAILSSITYDSYEEFINTFKFSDEYFSIDFLRYDISNAHFDDNGDGTGIVTYDVFETIRIPGYGKGSEKDKVQLKLAKVNGQWKIKEYYLVYSEIVSLDPEFQSLNTPNLNIIGSLSDTKNK